MPSASTKTEIPVSAEPTDPFKRVLNVVDKKVRNLEKRKLKLDAYKEKKDSGAELEKDQQVAVDKYGEVLTNLEFARDLQKQFSSINADAEKLLKKQAKRGKSEKQLAEVRRIKEVLQLQALLDSMGSDNVRQDFKTGKHGAIVLTEENLNQIDELYKLVSPTRDGEGDYLETLSEAADHIVSLLEAKDKPVVGSTYKTLKELLDLISGCGYFERVKEEEEGKTMEPTGDVEFEVVEHKDVPAADSEEVQASLPPEVPEEPEPTPEQPPKGMTTAEADAFFNTPVSQTVEQHEADLAAAAAFSQQQRRPFQEIVSSVQGNFNFLQESTIEMETKREFSPHMDPAVVAAHPMPPSQPPMVRPLATQTTESTNRPSSGFGASFPEQQSVNTAVTTVSHGAKAESSVFTQANQQQSQDFSNSGFTQSNVSHLQSDISFPAGSESGFGKGSVESAPISHTQYDIPPQLPMPPGHDQSNSQDSQGGSELDKKAGFQMNPNATEFQWNSQGEEQSKSSDDNFQGGTFTNSGFNSRDQRGGSGRGGFRGGRGGNRDSRGGGNMSNGYNRSGRGGNYNRGYQQRSDYRSNDGYQGYNGNNYSNSGGFQKRGGEGSRGAPRGDGNRGGQRGGFSRGGGGPRGGPSGPGGPQGANQPNPRGFGRPNFNN
ncbi:caprin-1-like [Mya arenaria]|uniref:caprin-1-like n=1 Tax=Mya arenaria TaxID=6604 RepID=UPI0022E83F79|nr:caprin-1-like [Mya arenaria]